MERAICTGTALGANEDRRKAQIQATIKLKDLLLHGGDVLGYVVRCCVRSGQIVAPWRRGCDSDGLRKRIRRSTDQTGAAFMKSRSLERA